jgi:hypothetical protein
MDRLYIKQMRMKPIEEHSYLTDIPVVKWLLESKKLDWRLSKTGSEETVCIYWTSLKPRCFRRGR